MGRRPLGGSSIQVIACWPEPGPEWDSEAIHAAARHAGADRYLAALPDGYETILALEYARGRDQPVGRWTTCPCPSKVPQ